MYTSANRVGRSSDRTLDLDLNVPQELRDNYKHRIFWHNRSAKSAYGYNTITTALTKPCLRRWLEFKGNKLPKDIPYNCFYDPPCIASRPARLWVLRDHDTEIATFTNVAEAWFVLLGEGMFSGRKLGPDGLNLLYVDRTKEA